jgi:hypothetical protein
MPVPSTVSHSTHLNFVGNTLKIETLGESVMAAPSRLSSLVLLLLEGMGGALAAVFFSFGGQSSSLLLSPKSIREDGSTFTFVAFFLGGRHSQSLSSSNGALLAFADAFLAVWNPRPPSLPSSLLSLSVFKSMLAVFAFLLFASALGLLMLILSLIGLNGGRLLYGLTGAFAGLGGGRFL